MPVGPLGRCMGANNHTIVVLFVVVAIVCLPLKSNPPSMLTVKGKLSCEQMLCSRLAVQRGPKWTKETRHGSQK